MEKRIKLIYILSLLSAVAAIGVQGYWLFNQYYYEAERYAGEVATEVLRVGNEEFAERKKVALGENTSFIIDRSLKTQSRQDSVSRKVQTKLRFNFFVEGLSDSIAKEGLNMIKLSIGFDASMPEDSIIHGVERAVVDYYLPFRVERLDSIFRERLPQYDFRISYLQEEDTLNRFASWKLLPGHLFPPRLGVKYWYAPLERKGVMIEVDCHVNPLLKRMGVQLALSLFLILLVLGCLYFQIKTILKQKELGELRESFVHTMIHELRRPVQTLKMGISFLKDKQMRADEAVSEEVVQDVMCELDNLSAYLGKLKNMVSADGSTTLLRLSSFDLKELVEKVIHLIHIPSGKHATISTTFPPALPPVTADPVHIANMLSNLIENAIKYSGPEVNIRVAVIRNGKTIELVVADDGMGISSDEQKKVFDKFYRSARLPDKQIPGLGLGLSYVRQIAEAHHGYVYLNSEIGKGTEITVVLPEN